ncbi:MAG: 50S ribosomal protein L18 [Bacteroidales bacterium]|nr:50S ribosomal protein L18 [Bacteroidales bacterium]HOY38293.1 50S ribosomal protein L18 [Bacteroidales bacterium]HQP04646.1 50S ribosomal protein L18 [Bacteroidales bacterium]
MAFSKQNRRIKIKNRIRKHVNGTPIRPRMTVYRSNKQISVQLIDDINGVTLAASTSMIKNIAEQDANKTIKAKMVGKAIAQKAIEAGITEVVFDRNGYLYHGRVKSLAEGAREGGLKF